MKKKLIILFFAFSSVSHPNYAMWSPLNLPSQKTAPSKGPATPSQAQAPMFATGYAGSRPGAAVKSSAVKLSFDQKIGDIVAKTLATEANQPAPQSSAVGSWFKMPEINVRKKSAEPQLQVNTPTTISVAQAPELFASNKPYEQSPRPVPVASRSGSVTMPVQNIEGIEAQPVQDGSVSQAQSSPARSVLGQQEIPIRRNMDDLLKKGGNQLKNSNARVKKYTKQKDYDDELKKFMDKARDNAKKDIKSKAIEDFNANKWGSILANFQKEREGTKLGQDEQAIKGLETQTRDSYVFDAINSDEGQAIIKKAQEDAKENFVKNNKLELKEVAAKQVLKSKEVAIRNAAEVAQRNSILESKIEDFSPKYQSLWKENFELKSGGIKLTPEKFKQELQTHLLELRGSQYEKLTPEDIKVIKKAGDKAVLSAMLQKKQDKIAALKADEVLEDAQNFSYDVPYLPVEGKIDGNMQYAKTLKVEKINPNILIQQKQFFVKENPLNRSAGRSRVKVDKTTEPSRSQSPTTVAVDSRSVSPVALPVL